MCLGTSKQFNSIFIILVSEDTISDDVGCINIQNLPFEMDDDTSVVIPSLIMYESNTIINGMIQLVLNIHFYKFKVQ
jgi:hypothetical protein